MKVRRWQPPPEPPPRRPYRDTVFVYGAMAVIVVLAAWVTGGDLLNALLIALLFFAVATGWSWRRLRQREREAAARRPPSGKGKPAS